MNQHNMNNINHLVALADKAADMSPDAKGAESRLLEVIAAQQRRIERLEIRCTVLLKTLETHLVENPVTVKEQYTTRVYNVIKENIKREGTK